MKYRLKGDVCVSCDIRITRKDGFRRCVVVVAQSFIIVFQANTAISNSNNLDFFLKPKNLDVAVRHGKWTNYAIF